MARAFIQIEKFPAAPDYFRVFRNEPIRQPGGGAGQLRIAQVSNVARMTLLTLMEQIAAARATEVLVAVEGNQSALNIPVAPGAPNFIISNGQVLLDAIDAVASGQPVSEADRAALGVDERTLRRFVAVRARLRGLRRVELRGCLVGRPDVLAPDPFGHGGMTSDLLQVVKNLFGCAQAGGPLRIVYYSRFSEGRPTTAAAVWEQWRRDHMAAVVDDTPHGRFAWQVDSFHPYDMAVMADSHEAVSAWLAEHVGAGRPRGRIPLEGLLLGNTRQRPAVFPQDAEFMNQLRAI